MDPVLALNRRPCQRLFLQAAEEALTKAQVEADAKAGAASAAVAELEALQGQLAEQAAVLDRTRKVRAHSISICYLTSQTTIGHGTNRDPGPLPPSLQLLV